MNNRDLFHATMKHENGEKLLHIEQGFNIPYEKWLHAGLPEDVANVGNAQLTPGKNLYDYMNVAGYLYCEFNQFCIPPFEEKILEEQDDRRIFINKNGVTMMVRTENAVGTPDGSPPHEIDFMMKTARDYEGHRYRLTGNTEQRYDQRWLDEHARAYCEQPDYPVTLWIHGPFAFLRELVGVENAMILPYTEPDMIGLMLKDHLETSMAAAEPVIKACKPDMCFIWEDCCGSSGPFISPKMFKKIMTPWYRAWKDYLVSMGVPWIMLDTDGDPSPLVTLWYEAGVDCMQPWEVNSVNMLTFAEEYPNYVMMGGIYKHIFEPGDPAQVGRFTSTEVHSVIDEELERVVKPMIKRGGYIAALDHWAFWGTTYDGYRYYSQRLTEKYGKANQVNRFGKNHEL
jgi:hypothetical protein